MKARKSRLEWGPFAEAVFQTLLIVVLPLQGLAAACIVILGKRHAWLYVYRPQITLGGSILLLLIAFLIVRALVWGYRNSTVDLTGFGTDRDRTLTNIQFWVVLVGSVSLPWVAAGIVHVVS